MTTRFWYGTSWTARRRTSLRQRKLWARWAEVHHVSIPPPPLLVVVPSPSKRLMMMMHTKRNNNQQKQNDPKLDWNKHGSKQTNPFENYCMHTNTFKLTTIYCLTIVFLFSPPRQRSVTGEICHVRGIVQNNSRNHVRIFRGSMCLCNCDRYKWYWNQSTLSRLTNNSK